MGRPKKATVIRKDEATNRPVLAGNDEFSQDDAVRIMDSYNEGKQQRINAEAELQKIMNIDFFNPVMLKSYVPDDKHKDAFDAAVNEYNTGKKKESDARDELVSYLEMFVYWLISTSFKTFTKYTPDLYQEGVVGILKSMDKYDPRKSKPSTFFYVYIMHEINAYLNQEFNKTTPHYGSFVVKVKRAIGNFERDDRDWNVTDIVKATGIPSETVVQVLGIIERSNEVHYENLVYLEDKVSENYKSPEDSFIQAEQKAMILNSLNNLTDDERLVVTLRMGIGDYHEPMSYKTIFEKTGISVENIKKYYNSAIRKLRKDRTLKKTFRNLIKEEKTLNDGIVGIAQMDIGEGISDDTDLIPTDEI
jgi:RNA polymerase sigma factor (sigma-70 family)